MDIRFCEIKGFPNYLIYEDGRIFSKPRGIFLHQKISIHGYKRVGLRADGNPQKMFFIHRLVGTHFLPKDLERKFINHKDGNKFNNHFSNLEWVTQIENAQHSRKILKQCLGQNNGNAKLTIGNVIDIKTLFCFGAQRKDLAKTFSVSRSTVERIVSEKNWSSL